MVNPRHNGFHSPYRAPTPRPAPTPPGIRARQAQQPMRQYDIAGLTQDGTVEHQTLIAAATPLFEDAFACMARGTLVQTALGPVAVEDLQPGMDIETADNGLQPLMWIGSMNIHAELAGQTADSARLTRITHDSFGLGRPMPDLVLASRARLLFRHPACHDMFGTPAGFAPARAFVDGAALVSVNPITPVRAFHLALPGQQTILANGLEIESYHPGLQADTMIDLDTREAFLGFFPHAKRFSDFGPMPLPRLTAFELDTIRAA